MWYIAVLICQRWTLPADPRCRIAPLANTYFMKQLDSRIDRVDHPSALPRENNEVVRILYLFQPPNTANRPLTCYVEP